MKKERLAQIAKPSAAANGFALSPIAPLSWAAVVGCRSGAVKQLCAVELHFRPLQCRWWGRPQSDQGSIASALKTIYGHKRKPRRGGRLSGQAGTTKETMAANRT